jgi:dTDP-4-amino-4,6-dideoxygalactose transaminase
LIPFEDLGRANRPFEEEFRAAFEATLSSGRYVLGEQVAAFEEEFAASLGVPHAVGVACGYDAVTLAFRALGITAGEVIVPANTYMATVLGVVRAGLRPVFSEPAPGTFLLDPHDVVRRITRRTVALLPVHLYGLVCDMDALMSIATEGRLLVVEDCSQAHGAAFRGRAAGSFGHASAFSFYPTKNLGALGDGGAVVTGTAEVADALTVLRNYGARHRSCADVVGLNSRLDELQAAFLRVKLRRLHEVTRRKNELAEKYDAGLAPGFVRPAPVAGAQCARHLYPVLHPERDRLRQYLASRGIGTEVHYPIPPYRQEALSSYCLGEYPTAEDFHRRVVSLPLSFGHSDNEIEAVIESANAFLRSE